MITHPWSTKVALSRRDYLTIYIFTLGNGIYVIVLFCYVSKLRAEIGFIVLLGDTKKT